MSILLMKNQFIFLRTSRLASASSSMRINSKYRWYYFIWNGW